MLSPKFVEMELAVAIHDDLIETFGGSFGLRDEGLLESALSQPKASFFGQLLHPTIAEQAAAYFYHLAKNHPFVDGNKRTALGVTEAFLGMNGYELEFSDEDLYYQVLAVVEGKLEKKDLADLLRSHLIFDSSAVNSEDLPSLEL